MQPPHACHWWSRRCEDDLMHEPGPGHGGRGWSHPAAAGANASSQPQGTRSAQDTGGASGFHARLDWPSPKVGGFSSEPRSTQSGAGSASRSQWLPAKCPEAVRHSIPGFWCLAHLQGHLPIKVVSLGGAQAQLPRLRQGQHPGTGGGVIGTGSGSSSTSTSTNSSSAAAGPRCEELASAAGSRCDGLASSGSGPRPAAGSWPRLTRLGVTQRRRLSSWQVASGQV